MMRRLLSFRSDQRGVASVELALMMPILFAFMFTSFEAGNYLWSEHKLIKGVRQGARVAARMPFTNYVCNSSSPGNDVTISTLQDASGQTKYTLNGNEVTVFDSVKNLMITGNRAGTGNAKVKGWSKGDITITLHCDSSTNTGLYETSASGASIVTVSTVVDYDGLYALLGFRRGGIKMRAQAQAAVTGV